MNGHAVFGRPAMFGAGDPWHLADLRVDPTAGNGSGIARSLCGEGITPNPYARPQVAQLCSRCADVGETVGLLAGYDPTVDRAAGSETPTATRRGAK